MFDSVFEWFWPVYRFGNDFWQRPYSWVFFFFEVELESMAWDPCLLNRMWCFLDVLYGFFICFFFVFFVWWSSFEVYYLLDEKLQKPSVGRQVRRNLLATRGGGEGSKKQLPWWNTWNPGFWGVKKTLFYFCPHGFLVPLVDTRLPRSCRSIEAALW